MEKMEDMDKQQADQMNKFATNMELLTGSIVEGFAMLRQIWYNQYHHLLPHHLQVTTTHGIGNLAHNK